MVFGKNNEGKEIPFACSYVRQRCVDYAELCTPERKAKVKSVDIYKASRMITEHVVIDI